MSQDKKMEEERRRDGATGFQDIAGRQGAMFGIAVVTPYNKSPSTGLVAMAG